MCLTAMWLRISPILYAAMPNGLYCNVSRVQIKGTIALFDNNFMRENCILRVLVIDLVA